MSATVQPSLKVLDQGGFAPPKPLDQGGFAAADQGGFAPGATGGGGTTLLSIGVLADPASSTTHFPLVSAAQFPRRAWDPALYAQAVLAEFGATGWMEKLDLPPPPSDPKTVAAEVIALLGLAPQRAARAGEIAAQSQDASPYWASMLMMTAITHPASWGLMITANTVGHMVAMHFKRRFARPRPAQVYPALLPMLPTPGHPSYPNAHALESALIAACLELAVPALGAKGEAQGPLDVLAQRIGENREIAGLHFASDTQAGRSLVPGIVALLTPCPLFAGMVAEAKQEWPSVTLTPLDSA